MCYIVPTLAAVTATFTWQNKKTSTLFWLMLMLYGGSLFGIIDHLLNGELFLISSNWLRDISLGGVITFAIFLTWRLILIFAKRNPSLTTYLKTTE